MKKFASIALAAFVLISIGASSAVSVHAQVITTVTGNAPVLYNQAGMSVNPNGGNLSAGYYYLKNGDQVYYYGNGIYYDPSSITQIYGGHLLDANGNLVYHTTPGAPNTGVGGVTMTWLTLITSGIVALAGMAYLGTRQSLAM